MCLDMNITVTGNALYIELTDWEKLVRYNFQRRKLQTMFDSMPERVAPALGMTKKDSPINAVVELDEQGKLVTSKCNRKTLVFLFTKSKEAVLVLSPYWLRESGCINEVSSYNSGSTSITVLH